MVHVCEYTGLSFGLITNNTELLLQAVEVWTG